MGECAVPNEHAAPEPLPEGTLTLLFSDIEGSTRLLDRLGLAYRDVLSTHRQIMRAAVRAHHGREMGTEGDSFFVVFRTAADAVAAAVQAQEGLATTRWPDDVAVCVRMGVHTGAPHLHEDGYVGMDVHLAARVASTATGGQVLLTDSTRALLPPDGDITLRDVGLHHLKDIALPQRLHEVALPGSSGRPGTVRSLGTAAGLPAVHGRLIGRDDEVQQVLDLLGPGRVVTVVGAGGVGKSRLAIAAAQRRADLPDGVWFVPLARAASEEEVWGALTEAAAVQGGPSSREHVLAGLARRRLLLVLDNLEHLREAAASVVRDVLDRAPDVEVLVTSRSPLHLLGEQLLPLPPLQEQGAVELFVEHVRRLRPAWSPDRDDLVTISTICQRLDRLPLAIELVAARSRLLLPSAILARLDHALDLAGRDLDRSERHLSLRSTLDWSWRLLDPTGARALSRLSVFRAPFDIEAAGAVLDTGPDDTVDVLLELVEASLLHTDEQSSGEPRFRLLTVLGRYAQERLAQDPAAMDDSRSRQAEVAADLVRRQCPRLRGTHHVAALDQLEHQHANIAQALDWCLRPGSSQLTLGLEMCRLLSWHWHTSSHQAEGRRWLARASEVVGDSDDPAALAAWHGLGILLDQQGEHDRAAAILQRCLDAAVARGDRVTQGRESNSLALVEQRRGNVDRARELFATAHDLARADGDLERVSTSLSNLAMLEVDRGNAAEALRLLGEVLAIDEALGDVWGVAVDRLNLAEAHLAVGNLEAARDGLVGHGAALLALGDGEVDVELLEHLALLAAALERHDVVPLLLGAADVLRTAAGVPRAAAYEQRLREGVAGSRRSMPPSGWREAVDLGATMSAQEAWGTACRELPDPAPAGTSAVETSVAGRAP